jgi:hypothetical protein
MSDFRRVTLVLRSPDFPQPAEIVADVTAIPRNGEKLVMDGRTYRVRVVLHDYDEGDISVFADEDTP